jgi:DNA-binding MarR family transcriptional regulator
MVSRTRDPADERRVMVDLTARGRALESEVRGITDKIKTVCQLTDADMDALRRTLEALAHPQSE